jgi:hypothetical protein
VSVAAKLLDVVARQDLPELRMDHLARLPAPVTSDTMIAVT